MRSFSIVSVAAIVIAVLVFLAMYREGASSITPAELTADGAYSDTRSTSLQSSGTGAEEGGRAEVSGNSENPSQAIAVRSIQGQPAGDELDLEWRRRHGFPDDVAMVEYTRMSAEEINQRAAAGDLVARVFQAGPLVSNPDSREEGIQLLLEAAADGSILALHELGGRLGPTAVGGSIEQRFAYWQAAAALGDLGMVPFLTQDMDQMTREQYAFAQVLFVQTMARITEISLARRGQGLRPSMRPLVLPER